MAWPNSRRCAFLSSSIPLLGLMWSSRWMFCPGRRVDDGGKISTMRCCWSLQKQQVRRKKQWMLLLNKMHALFVTNISTHLIGRRPLESRKFKIWTCGSLGGSQSNILFGFPDINPFTFAVSGGRCTWITTTSNALQLCSLLEEIDIKRKWTKKSLRRQSLRTCAVVCGSVESYFSSKARCLRMWWI